MKKQIFAAAMALCLMATTTLFAQENKPQAEPRTPPTAEQLAQRQTERMFSAKIPHLNKNQALSLQEIPHLNENQAFSLQKYTI